MNNQWSVQYSWQWTNWSKFSELKATSSQGGQELFQKSEVYSDNQRWSVGTTYAINKQWLVRAGFAYDEQAGEATLSIPDTDRYWYTAGFTYLWNKDLSIDAGFAYIDGKSGNFDETSATGAITGLSQNNYNSSGPAYIGSVQLNYSF